MPRRLRRLAAVLPAVGAMLAAGLCGSAQAAREQPNASARYVFTTFTNGDDNSMAVYTSTDASHFTLVSAKAFTPPSGKLRDPSIVKYHGTYYVAYTNAEFTQNTTSFGLASSTDLRHWTFLRNVTVPVAGTRFTWAPEWFTDTDGTVSVIVSISTATSGFNLQGYRLTALDPGRFTRWSAPAHLTGMNGNYLDDFVVKIGATYHDFTSNGTNQSIEQATASSATGPYHYTGTGNWTGWGVRAEGPALVRLPNGNWRIYVDGTWEGKYYYADSTDGLKSFSPLRELPGLSGTVRHGTVIVDN